MAYTQVCRCKQPAALVASAANKAQWYQANWAESTIELAPLSLLSRTRFSFVPTSRPCPALVSQPPFRADAADIERPVGWILSIGNTGVWPWNVMAWYATLTHRGNPQINQFQDILTCGIEPYAAIAAAAASLSLLDTARSQSP